MTHHRIGPIVDGVVVYQIELCNQQIDDADEIRDEDAGGRESTVVTCHREEEIDTCHGTDHPVDGDMFLFIDQTGKLPDGQSCYQGKQQDHSLCTEETGDNRCYKQHACNGSDDKILHSSPILF